MGLSALFHDIGKRQIPLEILYKAGPLNDSEWSMMQKHPQFGLTILADNPPLETLCAPPVLSTMSPGSAMAIPNKLLGKEIHPFARIVAIADTYDALTTQRSYNIPLKPIDALSNEEKLAGRYDPDLLKAMHSVLFNLRAS